MTSLCSKKGDVDPYRFYPFLLGIQVVQVCLVFLCHQQAHWALVLQCCLQFLVDQWVLAGHSDQMVQVGLWVQLALLNLEILEYQFLPVDLCHLEFRPDLVDLHLL